MALIPDTQRDRSQACLPKPFLYSRHLARIIAGLLVVFSLTQSLKAQSTAEIAGQVKDSNKTPLEGAMVQVESVATGDVRRTETNYGGYYAISSLAPGDYILQIAAPRFPLYTLNLSVGAGDPRRIDAILLPLSQIVDVTDNGLTPSTDSATLSASITKEDLENMPTSTRNETTFIAAGAPGLSEPNTSNALSKGDRPDDHRQSSALSANGQDDVLNNHLIDGTDNNERVIGTVGVKPSLDAIQEITAQTNNYAPEVGRTPGTVINIVTKRGEKAFHGSIFEFFQNDVFDARNPFNPKPNAANPISPKSKLRQNAFGGSLGGPVKENRTFFFFAYEGFRQVKGTSPVFSSVPTAAERQLGPQGIVDSDPFTRGLSVDPIAANLLKLYPLPNTNAPGARSNNFVLIPDRTQFSHSANWRADHKMSDSDLFYARYTLNNVETVVPDSMPHVTIGGISISPGSGSYGFSGPAKNTAHNFHLNYTHIFNSRLLMELKTAYTRINNLSNSPNVGTDAGSVLGFPSNVNYGPPSTGLPLIEIAGLQALGDSRFIPLQDLNNTFQGNGSVAHTRGAHNIKVGTSLIRRQVHMLQSANVNGNIEFSLPGGVNPLAAFLVGAFTGEGRSTSLVAPDYRTWEFGIYGQDTFRATTWLTLNYGARYDIYTPFTEAHNRISNFDLTTLSLLVAGVDGVSNTAGMRTDLGNFAPRVGFVASRHGIVLKGGFGVSYFPGNYTSNASLRNAPFTSVYAPSCASPRAVQIENALVAAGRIQQGQVQQACSTAFGQPTTLGGTTGGLPIPVAQTLHSPNLSLQAVQLDLKSGSVRQVNLVLEKTIGKNVLSAGYVGSVGRHLPVVINDINVPNPAGLTPAAIQASGRPTADRLPNLGAIGYVRSDGVSNYNALQLSFKRRFSQGLLLNANYAWAHSIDDVATLSNEGQEGFGNANPFDIKGVESGNSDLDLRHQLSFTSSYPLPFGKDSSARWARVLGGWQVNSLLVWNSGSPFSITNNYTGTPNNVFARGVGATPTRPNQIAPAKLDKPTVDQWFNRNAFVVPPPGVIGNAARNSLYGPHFRHLDLSLFKDFRFAQHLKLRFSADVFNVTNTPSYFIANDQNRDATTNLVPSVAGAASPAFGQIVRMNPNFSPRQFQFGLKLFF